MKRCFLAVTVYFALFLSQGTMADITEKDFQIISRTISFLSPPPSGDVSVAIVHDPSNATSQAEADVLKGILGVGFAGKGVTFKPILVTIADLSQAAGSGVIYVTSGLESSYPAITSAAKASKVISVSTDRKCVDSGACSLYVESSPKVVIVVNKASASAAGLEFQPALKMMIKEI